MFETPWAAVLDTGLEEPIDIAVDAKRLGLLEIEQSGSMIEASFPVLLAGKERELSYGARR